MLKADHYDMQIWQGLARTKENLHEEELEFADEKNSMIKGFERNWNREGTEGKKSLKTYWKCATWRTSHLFENPKLLQQSCGQDKRITHPGEAPGGSVFLLSLICGS